MAESLETARLGALLNRATRLFLRHGDLLMRPLGVVGGQIPTLMALRGGKALSQRTLAERAGIEQPSMAQTLARMERDGLIERTPDPADKRSSLVRLTRSAEATIPGIVRTLDEGQALAFAGFDVDEFALFRSMLLRIIENMEALERPAPPAPPPQPN